QSHSLLYGTVNLGYLLMLGKQKEQQLNILNKVICNAVCEMNWSFDTSRDALIGLSGIGNYLLCFEGKMYDQAVKQILKYLCDREYRIDSFYLDVEQIIDLNKKKSFPNGHYDLGLSHGLAGILLFLTNSFSKFKMNILENLIKDIQNFYLENVKFDSFGIYWPEFVVNNCKSEQHRKRESWCYGSPGILNSLLKSAKILKNNNLQMEMEERIIQLSLRPTDSLGLEKLHICHGYAGYHLFLEKWKTELTINDCYNNPDKIRLNLDGQNKNELSNEQTYSRFEGILSDYIAMDYEKQSEHVKNIINKMYLLD
ncbi:hypothetical protein FTE31_14440, partial [Listeria monocytogenes]|nr:hypothetical protein [Listeria monocytogenes]